MIVVFEDKDIIVVDKPAGIATQSAKVGEADMESELKKYRKNNGEAPDIYIVHRLDQPVSGLLVFAKTKHAAAELSKDMQREAFSKDYIATVYKPDIFVSKASLTDYLLKDSKTNSSKIVTGNVKGSKEARLSYETIESDDKTATLLVHLETGRHHQIRVQLSNAGMPLLGDTKYGTDESKELSKELGIKTVSLVAKKLTFIHPVTKQQMNFELEK